jgi:hypothetical protein
MVDKRKVGVKAALKPGTNIPARSDFELEYCEKLIEHGKKGHSLAEFCEDIGICEQTARRWRKHPEFMEAYQKFITFSKAWWNQQAQCHLTTYVDAKEGGTKFDTNLFKFVTGGRFGMSHQPDIDLPGLESGTLDAKHRVALRALARGQITPNQAATISQMLKDAIDIEAHGEMKERMEIIEKRLAEMGMQKQITKVAEEPEYTDSTYGGTE